MPFRLLKFDEYGDRMALRKSVLFDRCHAGRVQGVQPWQFPHSSDPGQRQEAYGGLAQLLFQLAIPAQGLLMPFSPTTWLAPTFSPPSS